MMNFKEKNFGHSLKKAKEFIKKNPLATGSLGLSAASLGVSGANALSNYKARKEGREDRKETTDAIKRLNRTLTKVDDSLNKESKNQKPEEAESIFKGMTNIFRQKNNSDILSNTVKGAGFGASVSGVGMVLSKNGKDNIFGKIGEKAGLGNSGNGKNKNILDKNRLIYSLAPVIIGAALGALWGGIKDLVNVSNKYSVGSKDILPRICDNLKNMGFQKDTNYTIDPKVANLLKTKVCVAISRTNGDLKLVVNMVNDPKLKEAANQITKNLPKSCSQTEKLGDRFNELLITTISDKNIDPALVSGILEQFIRRDYPVYIVEVG